MWTGVIFKVVFLVLVSRPLLPLSLGESTRLASTRCRRITDECVGTDLAVGRREGGGLKPERSLFGFGN